jgi:hypothetical protein
MKAEAATQATSVSQALTKGACPICGMLKDFQWTLATVVKPNADLRLCNFHTWAIARSRGGSLGRSTPGESVTSVFLEMLKGSSEGKVSGVDCSLCHRVREEEAARLRELAQEFQRAMFVQWMKTQGSLCVDHAGKLKECVSSPLRPLIDEIVERNRTELREELEAFQKQLKQGVHAGGGLLGRVAEFLVSQRGL